jgi:hypothetical protein
MRTTPRWWRCTISPAVNHHGLVVLNSESALVRIDRYATVVSNGDRLDQAET